MKDDDLINTTAWLALMFAVFWSFALAFSAEAPVSPEQRLKDIAYEKQILEQRFERGKLEMENAQFRFKELAGEEQRIHAEMKAKETPEKKSAK